MWIGSPSWKCRNLVAETLLSEKEVAAATERELGRVVKEKSARICDGPTARHFKLSYQRSSSLN